MNLRAVVGRRLEGGGIDGPLAKLASRAWGGLARLDVRLRWREAARVVVVGGATLGGSGKTSLAIACAEAVHDAGSCVTLVGHAYRASPRMARFVSEGDSVGLVGDEALICRHELSRRGIRVAVAPKRQDALDLGLSRADVAIVDGPCQTRPYRAAIALLAVNATDPWGAGRCPPRGDLRAPKRSLLAAVDRIVAIATEGAPADPIEGVGDRPVDRAWAISNGATLEGRALGWSELRSCRIGLWTALARPERIARLLAQYGVHPVATHASPDHGPAEAPPSGMSLRVDLWVCTSKCRSHLPRSLWGAPIATLDHSLRLEAPLKDALALLDPKSAHP